VGDPVPDAPPAHTTVERFDQAPAPGGETRRLYLSAHTLLGLDESVLDRRKWSYLELAHLLRRISDEPEGDVIELFGAWSSMPS